MRFTKEVTRTHRVVDHLVCDICGRVSAGDSWKEDPYEPFTVLNSTCQLWTGLEWPEGDWERTTWSIDFCPECFKAKLIPWVESFGITTIQQQTGASP